MIVDALRRSGIGIKRSPVRRAKGIADSAPRGRKHSGVPGNISVTFVTMRPGARGYNKIVQGGCRSEGGMLVSVVIANYNYGHFLGEAIDSVLAQTYDPIEVIVVDDGSSDDSQAVIASFGDQVVATGSPHAGQCAATNRGFAMSRGEVVIFLDADDVLLPGAVSTLVEPLRRDNRLVKSQGYLKVVDKSGTPTGEKIPRKLPPSGDYSEDLLTTRPSYRAPYNSGNAWRRWFLELVMPLPEIDYPDGYLNRVAPLFGPVESIPVTVAHYRIHDDNHWYGRTVFTAASLKKKLHRVKRNIDYVTHWAKKAGYQPPEERWHKWKRSWRHNLEAHSVALMDRNYETIPFHVLVLSPLMTGGTGRVKALALSVALAMVWIAPRTLGLTLARTLLNLPSGQRDKKPARVADAPRSPVR